MYPRRTPLALALVLAACAAPAPQTQTPECPKPETVAAPASASASAPVSASASAPVSASASVSAPAALDPVLEKLQAMARDSKAYDTVRSLVDEVGPRLAGSPGDKAAVAWGVRTMKENGLANVRAEKVMVPHWERGAESGRIVAPFAHTLAITALGGSVATKGKELEAEVFMVDSLEALEKADPAKVKGKIVFFSTPMARTKDGSGYGKAAPVRSKGAVAAAKKGAVGVVVRSVGTDRDRLPHTGALGYEKDTPKIPAAALAVPDAEMLERIVSSGKTVRLAMSLASRELKDAESANVIGEVVGKDKPEEVVLIGAHLDSWDLGTGAVDDGAGCAAVIEAARLILALPQRPKRTIRVVLFANEENGLRGATAYAKEHAAEVEKHQLALEMDLGAGTVHTSRFLVVDEDKPVADRIAGLLGGLGVTYQPAEVAWGGADTIPLRALGVPLADLHQDASRYFDVHHTANDTLDQIVKEEINQAVAAVATVAWAAADAPETLRRIPEDKRKRK